MHRSRDTSASVDEVSTGSIIDCHDGSHTEKAAELNLIPSAMCLHIILSYHVDTKLITEMINIGIIRIMTGSYSVYVVSLHGTKIKINILMSGTSAIIR